MTRSEPASARGSVLITNGLRVSAEFPIAHYEAVHRIVAGKQSGHALYSHYAGAWNALAYRYRACVDSGDMFVSLLKMHGTSPAPEERYLQERGLFDFFSAGFSVFECTFYALYTFGAMLSESFFSLASEKNQQQVTPARTRDAFIHAFPTDPTIAVFAAIFADREYQRWREVRNVLTHRTAPGRTIYVSLGEDDALPTEWKLNNSPLDTSLASNGLRELNRLLATLLAASARFAYTRF